MAFFQKIKEGLKKTRSGFTSKLNNLFRSGKLDDEFFEELEEILVTGDVGVETTMSLVEELREIVKSEKIKEPEELKKRLEEKLREILEEGQDKEINLSNKPTVILVLGVNGVGKTTTIGKLAHHFKGQGKKVILGAGDTFRAAAIEQLEVWGDRVGVDVISHKTGSDPAAVIFDTVSAAQARNCDIAICDTAGRLQTKKNLMDELGKINRVIGKALPGAPHEVLLILDATTGQNAISQAELFNKSANLTGIVLTKLDGTAKGGIVVSIKKGLNLPVKMIGVGEGIEDLQNFSASDYVEALIN